jgi:hypothetical protein
MNPPERAVVFSFDEKTQCLLWHKPAEEIIEEVRRGRATLTRSNARRATRSGALLAY